MREKTNTIILASTVHACQARRGNMRSRNASCGIFRWMPRIILARQHNQYNTTRRSRGTKVHNISEENARTCGAAYLSCRKEVFWARRWANTIPPSLVMPLPPKLRRRLDRPPQRVVDTLDDTVGGGVVHVAFLEHSP